MTASVTLVGVPWDDQSSFMRGSAAAPDAIRRALFSPSSNLSTEDGGELALGRNLDDGGDIELPAGPAGAVAEAITREFSELLARDATVIALGGDHAVTCPIVRAHARRFPNLAILHLDAHPDFYDDFEGQPYSHASTFARIMEAGLASRLVQVGIRTMNEPQRKHLERFPVEQICMRAWSGAPELVFDGPVYLSLDLDVLDPAFAPGVSHHEPGGLSVRDLLQIVSRLRGQLIGADVVELNPARDRDGVTAMVAAKLVKEIAARMLSGNSELGTRK
jgi:arginase